MSSLRTRYFFLLQNSACEVAQKMKKDGVLMWLLLIVGGQRRAGEDAEEKQKLSVKEYRFGQHGKVSPPSQQEQTSKAAREFHGLF